MNFCKIISTFHKNHSKKLIAMLLPIDSTLPIAKSIAKPIANSLNVIKKKHGYLLKSLSSKPEDTRSFIFLE